VSRESSFPPPIPSVEVIPHDLGISPYRKSIHHKQPARSLRDRWNISSLLLRGDVSTLQLPHVTSEFCIPLEGRSFLGSPDRGANRSVLGGPTNGGWGVDPCFWVRCGGASSRLRGAPLEGRASSRFFLLLANPLRTSFLRSPLLPGQILLRRHNHRRIFPFLF